jgi:DNA-binding IclR family transcriptional regulator
MDLPMNVTPKPWALLSKHGHALIHLAKNPRLRLVDLARDMDITERSVRLLLGSLGRSEFLRIVKTGRNNSYELDFERQLPHPFERQIALRKIVDLALAVAEAEAKESSGSDEKLKVGP